MSTQSASFIGYRQPGDCRPNADIVAYFSGETTDVPAVEVGNLVLRGSVSNVVNQGINFNGPGDGPLKIDWDTIKNGGSGVKLRCATLDLKQRIRFTVQKPQGCGDPISNVVALQLNPLESCNKGYEYDSELPLNLFKRCGGFETDCQITEEIARQFNWEYAHLGRAYQTIESVNGVNRYALDIEALDPAQYFYIEQHEGLSRPRVIVPANKRNYTRALVRDWFGTSPKGPTLLDTDTTLLNVIEIFTMKKVGTTFSGVATSSMETDTTTYTDVPVTITLVFETNVNGNAAFAKVKSLLKGPGSGNGAAPYIAKMLDDTCADTVMYPYTIARADDGSPAAFATIKTDYPEVKTSYLARYVGGKSYYEVYTGADTLPVPTSAKPGDTVLKGTNLVPDYYSLSSCPAGTACGDCPPSAAPL